MSSAEGGPVVGPGTPMPGPAESPEGRAGRLSTKTARIRIVGDQLKVADVESRTGKNFRFYCDEPPMIGGGDEYPQPLHYLTAAVGFWLLTQVTRYASMLRKTIDRAECEVEFDFFLEGSVLRGTVRSGARECRTRLHIDSPEPQEVIERIIRLAKQGCFAEQMVHAAVPLISSYVLNGVERDVPVPESWLPSLSVFSHLQPWSAARF